MRKMSRRKVSIVSLMALMILIIVLLVVPEIAANGATVVINPEGSTCTYFDFDDTDNEIYPFKTIGANKYKLISSNNDNGNITFQCEIWNIGNDTGSAIVYDSYDFLDGDGDPLWDCGVFYDTGDPDTSIIDDTYDWKQTISAAGDLKLTCHFQ